MTFDELIEAFRELPPGEQQQFLAAVMGKRPPGRPRRTDCPRAPWAMFLDLMDSRYAELGKWAVVYRAVAAERAVANKRGCKWQSIKDMHAQARRAQREFEAWIVDEVFAGESN